MMKAIRIKSFGDPDQLEIGSWDKPQVGSEELLVKVKATALNRADTLQRQGKYPPPKGESPILGLEMSGEVLEIGGKVGDQWRLGDRVCGLLGGGGYAQYACIHKDLAMPVPSDMSFEEAAAIPEVFLTAFQALNWLAGLQQGEKVLVHAGASGVGTAAIQLIRTMGATSLVTASASKHELCLNLGATHAIDYQTENFEEAVQRVTQGEGVDVVIDFIGASYFQRNLKILKMEGRLVLLAFMGGASVESLNLAPLLRKRLTVRGSTLRARSLEYKIALTRAFHKFAWPKFGSGRLKPVIDCIFDWKDVAKAHAYMEANQNKGKIVLKVH